MTVCSLSLSLVPSFAQGIKNSTFKLIFSSILSLSPSLSVVLSLPHSKCTFGTSHIRMINRHIGLSHGNAMQIQKVAKALGLIFHPSTQNSPNAKRICREQRTNRFLKYNLCSLTVVNSDY